MTSLLSVSVRDLKRAINLREKLESLEAKLAALLGSSGTALGIGSRTKRMSAAGRRRIADAQRARWAKVKGKGGRRQMSAAARAKIAAAARKRWKAAKAAGRSKL